MSPDPLASSVAAIAVLISLLLFPQAVRVGLQPLTPTQRALALALLPVPAGWSVYNFLLLQRARRPDVESLAGRHRGALSRRQGVCHSLLPALPVPMCERWREDRPGATSGFAAGWMDPDAACQHSY